MKVLLILVIIMLSSLLADDLEALLDNYEQSSDLSQKTKNESAGNLILYTRDDLERMQVESLKDLLKSLRFFSYFENRLGQADIYNNDPLTYYSKSIRVYLNENELLTSITGSGLISFGDMEMDFIDHVEIYEGFPSFDFGVESATIVIRLYTKTPERDEGGRIKMMSGSHGTNKQNVYHAGTDDDLSYFVYANHTGDKKDTYSHGLDTLRRDKDTKRFYGSLSTSKHTLELHAQKTNGDAFLGSLIGTTPNNTNMDSSFFNVAINSKLMDDTLSVSLSYINQSNQLSYNYDVNNPVFMPIDTSPFYLPITSLKQTLDEEALTAKVKKEWKVGINSISAGVQYRYKHFDLTNVTFNVPTMPITQPYYREDVYSVFLQDLIQLSDSNLITLSVMDQIYKRDGDVKDRNTLQLRLGYVYSDEKWVAKTFLSRQEFSSEPYMTVSPHYGYANLESEIYYSIFQEFSYKTSSTLSKIVLGYGVTENISILNPRTFTMINSDEDVTANYGALEFTLFFSEKDKLELQYNYSYMESPYGGSFTHNNYTLRMLNTISKFDIYNELNINNCYNSLATGYNYSLGVKYALTKDLHMNLKGDNIFDSGLEKNYINQMDPSTGLILDTVPVPVIERRFLFGMEYLF